MKMDLNNILVEGMQDFKEREPKARDYIWASEIGYPMYDRYHKMKGTKPTNIFTARTIFKFFVGSALEYSLQRMFERAGMEVQVQKGSDKCLVEEEGVFPVSGKYDIMLSAGGDWERAIWQIENNPLPDIESFLDRYGYNLAKYCQVKYPNGFEKEIIEVKTMNSMVFRSKINKGTLEEDYYHHQLQLYTYMKYFNMKSGKVFYMSKDDGLFYTVDVVESDKLKKDWFDDVSEITNYVKNNIEPPFHKAYEEKDGKYKMNWFAAGSMFLTHATGKSKEEFEEETKEKIKKLNSGIAAKNRASKKAEKDALKEVAKQEKEKAKESKLKAKRAIKNKTTKKKLKK